MQDVEGGGEYEIRAKQIVNATGVWTDDTQSMVGERGQFHVRASKGIHLVVPKDRIHSSTGLILRTEKSVLFVIPWGRHWIVGTTDTDWDLDKAHPAASSADSSVSPGMNRRTARCMNGKRGRCSLSHRFRAAQRKTRRITAGS